LRLDSPAVGIDLSLRAENDKTMSKKKNSTSPFVYSTDPGFRVDEDKEMVDTLAPDLQVLRISLETKHRAGKTVTLIT
jgi:translation initiation factor 1